MEHPIICCVKSIHTQYQTTSADREMEVVLGAASSALYFECISINPEFRYIGNIPATTKIVSIKQRRKSRKFSKLRFDYDVEMEVTGGALWSITVEACSKEEAIALALCRLKQAIALIPTNGIIPDFDDLCLDICYSSEVVSSANCPNYKNQNTFTAANLHFSEEAENRRQIIIEAYNLNPIEETYVFDQPYCCMADTLHNRLAEVLAWRR
jgi:hypothetical protein